MAKTFSKGWGSCASRLGNGAQGTLKSRVSAAASKARIRYEQGLSRNDYGPPRASVLAWQLAEFAKEVSAHVKPCRDTSPRTSPHALCAAPESSCTLWPHLMAYW